MGQTEAKSQRRGNRKPPPRTGRRPDNASVELITDRVEELLVDGYRRADVQRLMRQEHPELAVRTVDEYIARVKERWLKEAEEQRPIEREATLRRLLATGRTLRKSKAYNANAAIERLIVDVQGLKSIKVEGDVSLTHRIPDAANLKEAAEDLEAAALELERLIKTRAAQETKAREGA